MNGPTFSKNHRKREKNKTKQNKKTPPVYACGIIMNKFSWSISRLVLIITKVNAWIGKKSSLTWSCLGWFPLDLTFCFSPWIMVYDWLLGVCCCCQCCCFKGTSDRTRNENSNVVRSLVFSLATPAVCQHETLTLGLFLYVEKERRTCRVSFQECSNWRTLGGEAQSRRVSALSPLCPVPSKRQPHA